MSKIFVLDACALVAVLKDENGADIVAAAYSKAETGEARIIMNRANLLEVYYSYYRDNGKNYAEKIMDGIAKSVISISEFDKTLFPLTSSRFFCFFRPGHITTCVSPTSISRP